MMRYWFMTTALILLTRMHADGAEVENSRDLRVRALLSPAREAVISSQLAGRIVEMKEQVGMSFSRGDALVRFDCSELDARLKMAEAEQQSAELILKTKQELFKLQSAGETEVALAAAAAAKAKSQTVLQKTLMEACEIRAPFDGSVTRVAAHAFQSVNQGQALMEIVSLTSPRARMNVPSRWLEWLKAGVQFRLTVDETGRSYTGRITLVSARVDPVSQTVEIEGEVESATALVAGMSGYASFKRVGKQR